MDTDAAILEELIGREQAEYARLHPRSRRDSEEGQRHYLYGAPSHWMRRWAGGFPLYGRSAGGAHLQCVDGLDYVDFCLGDTGAMGGHGPAAVTSAVARQLERGATTMLPTEDAGWVGGELTRRFGLPYWGFTTSASDANRAAIRIARMITGRAKVLVFNGCYHGSVEEAHVALRDGLMVMRNGIHPNAVDHRQVSRVIEFNDAAALEEALSARDVACILAEPFMTNFGMIAPRPGFLDTLREATRRTGTLLVIDETHTFSSGPGGYSGAHGLEPDFLVVGKSIGGGVPVGLTAPARRLRRPCGPSCPRSIRRWSGRARTSASAAPSRAVRCRSRPCGPFSNSVLTPGAFDHMTQVARGLAEGARKVLSRHGFPWSVVQLGARVEILFSAAAPANAAEAARARNDALEALLHVYCLNRGVLVTPFHCMLLTCPATLESDAQRFVAVLDGFCSELARRGAVSAPR